MKNFNTSISNQNNTLQYLLASSAKNDDLEEFNAIVSASHFSDLSEEYIGNAAFLAAFLADRESFIHYLILDKKIPKTKLVSELAKEEYLKLFNTRD